MWEYILIFISSTLASAHCIGMCGGFALIIGLHSNSWRRNLAKQLIYSAGRVLTYSSLGLTAGILGTILVEHRSSVIVWQAVLAIFAGVLLVLQSIHAFGFKIKWNWFGNASKDAIHGTRRHRSYTCRAFGSFRALLTGPEWINVFLAGVLTGFLLCCLVCSFLALAASRAHAYQSWLSMVVFGIGTIPLMVTAGIGSNILSVNARRNIWRVAAICVFITGTLSITRGVYAWQAVHGQSNSKTTACPCCNQ